MGLGLSTACAAEPPPEAPTPPPSEILLVLGAGLEGPALEGLAADGLRYSRAWSPSLSLGQAMQAARSGRSPWEPPHEGEAPLLAEGVMTALGYGARYAEQELQPAALAELLAGLRADGPRWAGLLVVVAGLPQPQGLPPEDPAFWGQVQIPLVIGGGAIPRALRGQVRGEHVSLLDLLPTLAAAAGSVAPAGAWGRDLLAPQLQEQGLLLRGGPGEVGWVGAQGRAWVWGAPGEGSAELLSEMLQRCAVSDAAGGRLEGARRDQVLQRLSADLLRLRPISGQGAGDTALLEALRARGYW